MNKEILIQKLLAHLGGELTLLKEAANNARLASIDEQSVAETQYDTLAIEAGYLAEGQARRVAELSQELEQLKQLKLVTYHADKPINLGALVQLSKDEHIQHWYFLLPAGAGFKTKESDYEVTVITPQSPIGKNLMGKHLNDEISLTLAHQQLDEEIIKVI